MGSGERTKALLVQVLIDSGHYRPLTKLKGQIRILIALFEDDCRDGEPWESRVREGAKGRAGPLIEDKLRQRAEQLGLLKNRQQAIANLRRTQELIYERYGDRDHPEYKAIEYAIGQLNGSIVHGRIARI